MNVDANEDMGTILSSISSNITLPQLIVGIGQSVGIQRDHNEDALMSQVSNLVSGDRHLHFGIFIVADGMGGHEDGEIASSVAV
jgi:serine/threonine protein phosphatase PrpC